MKFNLFGNVGKRAMDRFSPLFIGVFSILFIQNQSQGQILRVKDGIFQDVTGKITPVITNGKVTGDYYAFDNTAGSMIRIPDLGNFDFNGGFTIKAEVYFEKTPAFGFAFKYGTMSFDLINGKLTSSWMTFPSETIFTTNSTQFKYFPVGTELLHGYQVLPLNEWVTIEVSYDEQLGVTTTKINGEVDRVLVRYRGKEKLMNTPSQSLRFLENGKDVRVREFSFTPGKPTSSKPTMNVYANALPYLDKLQLTFDQIDNRLPLPISFTVYLQRPGQLTTSFVMKLNSVNRKDTLIPLPAWNGRIMNVKIKNSWLDKDFAVGNRKAPNPYTGKYPLFMYHAKASDFRMLNSMGFNIIQNDFNVMGDGGAPAWNIKQSLDTANLFGMGVFVVAKSDDIKLGYVSTFKSNPALYGWYLADEPTGADLLEMVREYNTMVKAEDEKRPTMVMMNNFNRLTGLDCDIIGVDPFPIPNVSLRMVADAVKAGLKAGNYNKPVWCLIPHFTGKIPNLQELKAMVWIGIIEGAAGMGMFEWDHRSLGTPNGYYAGNDPTHVANIGTVFREARSWDWLLNAPAIQYNTGNLAVHACTKTANGKTYLLIANDSRKAESATIRIGTKTIVQNMNALEVKMLDMATL